MKLKNNKQSVNIVWDIHKFWDTILDAQDYLSMVGFVHRFSFLPKDCRKMVNYLYVLMDQKFQ